MTTLRMTLTGIFTALLAALFLYIFTTSLAGFIPHGPLWPAFVWAAAFLVGLVDGLEAR